MQNSCYFIFFSFDMIPYFSPCGILNAISRPRMPAGAIPPPKFPHNNLTYHLCKLKSYNHATRRRPARIGQSHAIHARTQHPDPHHAYLLVLLRLDVASGMNTSDHRSYPDRIPTFLRFLLRSFLLETPMPRVPGTLLPRNPQCT